MNCTEACPKDLNPAKAIAEIKQMMAAPASVMGVPLALLPELGKLRWRCRRGMKELDILLARYMEERFAQRLASEQEAFRRLLEIQDPVHIRLLFGPGKAPGRSSRP